MNNRSYYTYAEILFALREYYQDVQNKLNKMNEMVELRKEEFSKSYMNLVLKYCDYNDKINTKPSIHLYVKGNFTNYEPIHFIVHKMNNRLSFFPATNILSSDFKLENIIPDTFQQQFANLYHELKQMPLYNLPEEEIKLNSSYWFILKGDGLDLINKYVNSVYLKYRSHDDKIHVGRTISIDYSLLEDLLFTKIPINFLSNATVSLLEKYYGEKDIRVDELRALAMEDENNELVLKKTLKNNNL